METNKESWEQLSNWLLGIAKSTKSELSAGQRNQLKKLVLTLEEHNVKSATDLRDQLQTFKKLIVVELSQKSVVPESTLSTLSLQELEELQKLEVLLELKAWIKENIE